jgi:N-methylhydantoinase B
VAGGGGGYGEPTLRPVEQVIREVRNGILSLQKAHEEYGIVLDPMTMELKQTETEQLRRKSKK